MGGGGGFEPMACSQSNHSNHYKVLLKDLMIMMLTLTRLILVQ